MRKDIAEIINQLMLDYGAKLDQSLKLVMDTCSQSEFESYRAAVGQMMSEQR